MYGRTQGWASAIGISAGLGALRCAIRALMGAIGLSEIAAGVEPAYGREKVVSVAEQLAHEVSILLGVGRHFGW